ncbi:helix-turn-helix domain-containing protein [Paenibacillus sp. FSL L8-0708]|uniref:helix-turn-helix domain-containing protein n=1 Tax=Paenibacillus sp. FSL L8-0708 TaxID=2975311 RepID=UPI0030F4F45D
MAKGKYHEWLTPEGLALLEGWARDGLTDEQIADNMGIKRPTLYEWKKRYPDISDTLKKGKEVIDRHVENALLKRALGYRYDEVTREPGTVEDKETGELKQVMVETKRVTKEVQGDTTAQIFWLKNRKPEQWRDKQDVQHSGSVNVNNPYKDLTTDELRKLIRDV